MIRTKGEAGTGDVIEAVRHHRTINEAIRSLKGLGRQERIMYARDIEAPAELVIEVAELQRLPVINYAAGGIATPADAAMMMQLGCDGVFVGSGIFKSTNPAERAKAIVEAVRNFNDPLVIAEVSKGLGEAMRGISVDSLPEGEQLQTRGY